MSPQNPRNLQASAFDLNLISVSKPCHEDWDAMRGDDRARFCGKCEKTVYDLSALTEQAAKQLILDKGGNLCVQYRRRADGTVVTASCPTGVLGARGRRWGRAAAAAALAVGAFATGQAQAGGDKQYVDVAALKQLKTELLLLREQHAANGQQVSASATDEPVLVCGAEDEVPNATLTVTVRAGDTVASLAKQWNSREDWIRAANSIPDSGLQTGAKVTVPYVQVAVRGRVATPVQAPMVKGKVVAPTPQSAGAANPTGTVVEDVEMGEMVAPAPTTPPAGSSGAAPRDGVVHDKIIKGEIYIDPAP